MDLERAPGRSPRRRIASSLPCNYTLGQDGSRELCIANIPPSAPPLHSPELEEHQK